MLRGWSVTGSGSAGPGGTKKAGFLPALLILTAVEGRGSKERHSGIRATPMQAAVPLCPPGGHSGHMFTSIRTCEGLFFWVGL